MSDILKEYSLHIEFKKLKKHGDYDKDDVADLFCSQHQKDQIMNICLGKTPEGDDIINEEEQ